MNFALTYQGPLKSSNGGSRAADKHRIRLSFHEQLAELWKQQPTLSYVWEEGLGEGAKAANGRLSCVDAQKSHPYLSLEGYRVLPIVPCVLGVGCSLQITFLRRGFPGYLVEADGDIDNRLKLLLDSLRMPHHAGELAGHKGSGVEWLFCLLEDDSLITSLHVDTGQLLTPDTPAGRSEVHLVVHVRLFPTKVTLGSLPFV